MDFFAVFVVLCLAVWTIWYQFLRRRAAKRPPGPKPYPIIGNINLLGKTPHQSLAKLSKTYGPLMSLHLGRKYTIVVSSPEMARQILQKHDQNFSNRTIPIAAMAHNHYKISMAFSPAESKWKKFRKVSKEQMFTFARLESNQGLRQEKLQQLFDYVQKCCDTGRTVNIGEAIFITVLNLISATLFSTQFSEFDSNATHELKTTFGDVAKVVGVPNFADYFPVLKLIDPQGIERRSKIVFGKLLGLIGDIINQRLQSRSTSQDSPKKTDMLETLLDLREGSEYNFDIEDIKHLLLDLLVGSETTYSTVEWAMTELLLHPDKLSKAKQELRTVIGEKIQLQESDISRLPYFQAVIKEVFRLHPAGPLLLPRKAEDEVEISGYIIPKGTQVFVNVWAMGRDPSLWSNPESFEPERFLDNKIDFKGQDFELLPFGSGKRMCPAVPLANRMFPMTVATLIHNFDWKLIGPEAIEVHRREVFGLSLGRAVPLKAIPIKCEP